MYKDIILDCRDLEAPEPLNLVVENLEKIDQNTYIKMIHRMEPQMLFNILKSNGYEYKISYEEDVIVYIYKDENNELKNYIKGL
jgi:hypothetical protein